MEDFSSDSSSVSDFHSLDSASIYGSETCDSLIAGFQQCKVAKGTSVNSQQISTEQNVMVTDFSTLSLSNKNNPNKNMPEKTSAVEFQENPLNNERTHKKATREIGVNTDRRSNYKVTNFRRPYFKYKKHLNQYHNFKRIFHNYSGTSKKQRKTFKKYRNNNKTHRYYNNNWHFQKPQCQEDREIRGFYFFTQLMRCFNGRF